MGRPCCSGSLHRIGEDVAERLDIVPAQFRVLVVRRPKYACRTCEDVVVQAAADKARRQPAEGSYGDRVTVTVYLIIRRIAPASSKKVHARPLPHHHSAEADSQ